MKKLLKNIAEQFLIKIDKKVLQALEDEQKRIYKKLEKLINLNVEQLKPMTHVSNQSLSLEDLREDKIKKWGFKKSTLLNNAYQTKKDFVQINEEKK